MENQHVTVVYNVLTGRKEMESKHLARSTVYVALHTKFTKKKNDAFSNKAKIVLEAPG